MNEKPEFSDLIGKTLKKVVNEADETLTFITETDDEYSLAHDQDCCERVLIEDICGDLDDLIGSPIIQAEESSSDKPPEGDTEPHDERVLWTFYRIATTKGLVVIRWLGESNGYYGVEVSFNLTTVE